MNSFLHPQIQPKPWTSSEMFLSRSPINFTTFVFYFFTPLPPTWDIDSSSVSLSFSYCSWFLLFLSWWKDVISGLAVKAANESRTLLDLCIRIEIVLWLLNYIEIKMIQKDKIYFLLLFDNIITILFYLKLGLEVYLETILSM